MRKTFTFPAGGFEIQVLGKFMLSGETAVFSCEHAYLVTGGVETPAILLNVTQLFLDLGCMEGVALQVAAQYFLERSGDASSS